MTNHRFQERQTNGHAYERSLGDVASEMKSELKEFVQTRVEMLRSELDEKAKLLKMSVPLMAVGAFMAMVAFLLLSFALVAAVSLAFEGMRAPWALAALIVGVAYLLIGAVAAWVGWRELRVEGMAPKRTLRVLRDDQTWLQHEAGQVRSEL